MPPLIPDEDKNFGGSLVLDFSWKAMAPREKDLWNITLFRMGVASCYEAGINSEGIDHLARRYRLT